MSKAAEKRLGPLDSDIAGAAARIQQLRDTGQLRDARRLILHLKPNGKRIGLVEVGSVRTYEVLMGTDGVQHMLGFDELPTRYCGPVEDFA